MLRLTKLGIIEKKKEKRIIKKVLEIKKWWIKIEISNEKKQGWKNTREIKRKRNLGGKIYQRKVHLMWFPLIN